MTALKQCLAEDEEDSEYLADFKKTVVQQIEERIPVNSTPFDIFLTASLLDPFKKSLKYLKDKSQRKRASELVVKHMRQMVPQGKSDHLLVLIFYKHVDNKHRAVRSKHSCA